jgi:hypothetical protein
MVANLNYSEFKGRRSIIELLGEIFRTFPTEVVSKGTPSFSFHYSLVLFSSFYFGICDFFFML